MAYDKYKTKCNWFLLFDFDEYLEIFFEKGKNMKLKEFLTNNTYEKCEAILFNWVIYTDNDLLNYDNRTLIERFTEPNFFDKDNMEIIHFGVKIMVCDKKCENIAKIWILLILFYRKCVYLQIQLNKII